MWDKLQERFQYLQFSRKQQQAFLEDLSSLIKDGVPANQAVKVIQETAEGVLQEVAANITAGIAEGQPVAYGMRGWFSPATVEIIRAGESSGTLAQAMESAATSLAQQTSALGEFINSTLYPLVIFVASLIMLVFIKRSVFENFASIKPVDQWQGIGENLYHLASFLENWWWLVGVVLFALVILIRELLHQLIGASRKWLDEVPLLSLYRQATAARFMETLGALLSNGVAMNKALRIMHKDAQPYFAWHLWMMEMRLSGGKENIADVLDTNLVSDSDLMRLKVIAKGKGFEHALVSLGRRAHMQATRKVASAGKLIGGILLVLGAMMAASIVFGIYTIGSIIAS